MLAKLLRDIIPTIRIKLKCKKTKPPHKQHPEIPIDFLLNIYTKNLTKTSYQTNHHDLNQFSPNAYAAPSMPQPVFALLVL